MLKLETKNVLKNSPPLNQNKRINSWKLHNGKVMPYLNARFFGIFRNSSENVSEHQRHLPTNYLSSIR